MFSFFISVALYLVGFVQVPPAVASSSAQPQFKNPVPVVSSLPQVPRAAPVKVDDGRLGVATEAKAVTVVDWETGITMLESGADSPRSVASITKLMTALVAVQAKPDWNAAVEIQGTDLRAGAVSQLSPGDRLPLRDVLAAMLIGSSNEAAVAVSRSSGYSPEDFIAQMNETATRLGMGGAMFLEPTGLNSGNVASARDVAVLARAALSQEMISSILLKSNQVLVTEDGIERKIRSTDELLGSFLDRPPYRFLGGKTGYLVEAGYCFAAASENADGHKVIAVALGAPTKEARFSDVKAMIFWAFDAYRWP